MPYKHRNSYWTPENWAISAISKLCYYLKEVIADAGMEFLTRLTRFTSQLKWCNLTSNFALCHCVQIVINSHLRKMRRQSLLGLCMRKIATLTFWIPLFGLCYNKNIIWIELRGHLGGYILQHKCLAIIKKEKSKIILTMQRVFFAAQMSSNHKKGKKYYYLKSIKHKTSPMF